MHRESLVFLLVRGHVERRLLSSLRVGLLEDIAVGAALRSDAALFRVRAERPAQLAVKRADLAEAGLAGQSCVFLAVSLVVLLAELGAHGLGDQTHQE